MAWRTKFQFYALTYLTAQHWAPVRAVMAGLGYVCVLLCTGWLALAQDTARLFWIDDYKTALHRLDWFAHYGWLGRFFARKPAFDICHDMPPAGLDALYEMLVKRDSPADLRARLYLASHCATQARSAAKRAAFFDSYRDIAGQITRQIPTSSPDLPKHAPTFTQPQARATLQAAARLMQSLDMPWYIVQAHFWGQSVKVILSPLTMTLILAFIPRTLTTPALCQGSARTLHSAWCALTIMRISSVLTLCPFKCLPFTKSCIALVSMDILLHHLEGGQRWHGSVRHRWWNVVFETAPYDLAELTVFGPADANTYLRENYGDWRPPKTAFNCSTGTPNVSFNRNLVSIAQFLTQAQAGSAIAQSVLATQGYVPDGKFTLPWD